MARLATLRRRPLGDFRLRRLVTTVLFALAARAPAQARVQAHEQPANRFLRANQHGIGMTPEELGRVSER